MILKRIKNGRRKSVRIDSRIDYIHETAQWESCSHSDFKTLLKSCQHDERSAHFVVSFDDDSKHRTAVENFFRNRFSDNLLYIGEHNEKRGDQRMTAYHIVLSRNLNTGLMINLSKKELEGLKADWHAYIKNELNPQQREKLNSWRVKQEVVQGLEPWQMGTRGHKSYKAYSMDLKNQFVSLINKQDFEGASELLQKNNASFEVKTTEAGRERVYINFMWSGKMKSVSLSNIDRNVKEELKRLEDIINEYSKRLTEIDDSCQECRIRCNRVRKISSEADDRDRCIRKEKEDDARKFHERSSQLDEDVVELEQEFERVYGRSETADIGKLQLESVAQHSRDVVQYFDVNTDLQSIIGSQGFKRSMSLALNEKEVQKEMQELQRALKRFHSMGYNGFIKDFSSQLIFQAKKQKDPVLASAFSFLSIVFSLISMMSHIAISGYKSSNIYDCKIRLKELKRAQQTFSDTDRHMEEVKQVESNRKTPDCNFDMTM